MKNKRKVYVYSETRDYMTAEYIDLFESMNAELVKGTEEDLERFITSNPMQQLDTETNVTEHYTLRELYVIQLGTYADEQHIIDVKDMSTGVDKLLRKLFADKEMYS
jgi:UDP-glucose 6-dehydrogenase